MAIDEVNEDGWYCTGSVYYDCDPEFGNEALSCEGEDAWSTYEAKFVPESEGEDYFLYYLEYADTYYHEWCYDEAKVACVD